MSYEFQGTLFRTRLELAAAVAYEWMTAGGLNSPAEVDKFMPGGVYEITPEAAATEAVENLGLTDEWLTERELDVDDLAAAFEEFFSDRPDRNED